jgi:hypothetical protein
MKLLTTLLATIVTVVMASTVLALDYKNIVAEGYRWVSIDGPYACPVKEDLRRNEERGKRHQRGAAIAAKSRKKMKAGSKQANI